MANQHDDVTRPQYYLARVETLDGRQWNSLHLTNEDAERQRKAVADAWGVEFNIEGEPATGFLCYAVEHVEVLGPEESGQAPDEESTVRITKEEMKTWEWLVMRDVPGGLSADEMADELGITSDVAALRLVSLAVLDLANEVSPGRYRAGEKDG